jgi:hypothetical protein
MAMGLACKRLLASDCDCLMLQHHSYAACDDQIVRERVRHRYALLLQLVRELSGADDERLDQFFGRGMALNVAAAMGVSELSAGARWVREQLLYARASQMEP